MIRIASVAQGKPCKLEPKPTFERHAAVTMSALSADELEAALQTYKTSLEELRELRQSASVIAETEEVPAMHNKCSQLQLLMPRSRAGLPRACRGIRGDKSCLEGLAANSWSG